MFHTTGRQYLRDGVLPHMWCPGCGIGVMLRACLRSFEELGWRRQDTVVVTGIGCTGKLDDYLTTHALHTTHGRALAFATGIRAANPALHVVVFMGDGDGVTIGGNHFLHAARRNIDLTAIVLDNFNFGMTGGQFSGTTGNGAITQTSVYGNPERALDICALAEVAGANYVARSTPFHVEELGGLITEALDHRGFSVVEVLSPCPTHFGANNRMKQPVEMLHWLRDRTVPVEVFRTMTPEERDGRFPIGRLVDRHEPDFDARWAEVVVRATAQRDGRLRAGTR
jgi:2-oxoglutarate ferredoxin oxidoreductase subunit beta